MKNRFYNSSALLSFVLFASLASAQSPATGYKELPNFHEVNARLFRGGQPRAGGLKRLASLGVKTVVNLREADEVAADEEREARSLGLRYFNVPVSLGGRPSVATVGRVLALINAPENQPAFVHCRKGADRTGVVVAAYRITHDRWTAEAAQREADEYGMGWWQRGKKDFIKDYSRDMAAAPAAVERPSATPSADKKSKQGRPPGANEPRQ